MFLFILRPEAEPARVVIKLKAFFKQTNKKNPAAFAEECVIGSSLTGMERVCRQS